MLFSMKGTAETYDAVYVEIQGQEPTCYLLNEHPQIVTSKKNIVVKVNGKEMLNISLTDNRAKIFLGKYEHPDAVNKMKIDGKTPKDGTYLIDGKLYIIKNGKRYNINGTLIKSN